MQRVLKLEITTLLVISVWVLLASGCGGTPVKPYALKTHLSAALNINPDRVGVASPVSIYVFQLTDSAEFDSRDYFTLADSPADKLDDTVLDKQKILMTPDSTKFMDLKMNPAARAIGAIAAFRQLNGGVWRSKVQLAERNPQDQTLVVQLQANNIQLRLASN